MSALGLPSTRLSALVVSHDSGAFALRCVESLQLDWERGGREAEDLEVVVVDSGSTSEQDTWLERLRALGATVIELEDNVGYAGGVQRALAETSGEPEDVVAVLNPDLVFLPGSVTALLEHLEDDAGCGAVGPRAYVDEERQILLPPCTLPTPLGEVRAALVERSHEHAAEAAEERFERELAFWQGWRPSAVEMLSGACLLLRREVIARLGELMDPAFPLYYEDADLCQRLASLGYRLMLVPEAEVLHHWSRSAGVGEDFAGEPARRWAQSRRRFLEKHHGAAAGLIAARLEAPEQELQAPAPLHVFTELGERVEPPELGFERDAPFVVELSLSPAFGLCAGVLGQGASWRIPPRTWAWLFRGTYHARALERGTGRLLGAWRFTKAADARAWPLDPATEIDPDQLTRAAEARAREWRRRKRRDGA